jgi:hypothetical protein
VLDPLISCTKEHVRVKKLIRAGRMFKWISQAGEDARVKMCVKSVLWELEMAGMKKRAKILLLAQTNRFQWTSSGAVDLRVLENPLAFPRADMWMVYETLEAARNRLTAQAENIKRQLKAVGMPIPPSSEADMKDSVTAIEIWMCVVGMGIVPQARESVWKIWTVMLAAAEHIPDALAAVEALHVPPPPEEQGLDILTVYRELIETGAVLCRPHSCQPLP